MKRIVISVIAALFCIFQAQAQKVAFHFGVEGGVTLNSLKSAMADIQNKPGCHAGLVLSMKLPAHFSIQPSLQYEWGHANSDCYSILPPYSLGTGDFTVHSFVVPIALQWGPDLGVFRPFVQVVPFAGMVFNGRVLMNNAVQEKFYARPQVGVGLGGGLEIWRVQLSARYNWVFADWLTTNKYTPFGHMDKRYGGVTVTASIFLF